MSAPNYFLGSHDGFRGSSSWPKYLLYNSTIRRRVPLSTARLSRARQNVKSKALLITQEILRAKNVINTKYSLNNFDGVVIFHLLISLIMYTPILFLLSSHFRIFQIAFYYSLQNAVSVSIANLCEVARDWNWPLMPARPVTTFRMRGVKLRPPHTP
jgi:hypothetical protein